MTRPALAWLVLLIVPAVSGSAAAQEEGAPPPSTDEITLSTYLAALAGQRLLAEESGSVERLRELVRRGEEAYFDGRFDQAALLLFEVAESPRFADFVDLPEFRGAEYMLAGAVQELGALRTASRYLERILTRGMDDPYFAPAVRRYVDVALDGGDLAAAIEGFEALGISGMPEDAENELRYLRGRERYEAGDHAAAEQLFAEVTRRSRFFANSQYFRGVIAVRQQDYQTAENHFCSIATTADTERFTFFVDGRYFEVKDQAWLALGRVAHEMTRAEDAFYYYFQIPNDSEQVAAAMFEAAYAMYEGRDNDTAIDLLDQLEARFPSSPYADEATLLRGYIELSRCEFDAARRSFRAFLTRFGPIVEEIDNILENPARQEGLYRELLDDERRIDEVRRHGDVDEVDAALRTRGMVLAMLRVDPAFFRLHADVRILDAESARAGRLGTEIAALGARLRGADRPRAATAREQFLSESEQLASDLQAAREALAGLARQLDSMRRAGAARDQLRPLEVEIRAHGQRIAQMQGRLREAVRQSGEGEGTDAAGGEGIDALLARDARNARRLPGRVAEVRGRMLDAANAAALRALRELRERLAAGVRRARIGQIDAVMGSKRRIEIQIESLAAGRFPPELLDPLAIQGLLRDDEEYWPFEGELWEDEFEESLPDEDLEEEEEEE